MATATIPQKVAAIRNARYGEEVRESIASAIEDMDSNYSLLTQRITSLESRATNIERDITSLKSRATDLEGRVTTLEGRATALEGRVTTLEGRADDSEEGIGHILKYFADYIMLPQVTPNTSDIASLKTRTSSIESNLSSLTSAVDTIVNTIESFGPRTTTLISGDDYRLNSRTYGGN